jgi:hypothetical protein
MATVQRDSLCPHSYVDGTADRGMRGDVLDGAEDPLLELDVLGNRLEDELASAKISGEAGWVLVPQAHSI